jgi:hypothetical protein
MLERTLSRGFTRSPHATETTDEAFFESRLCKLAYFRYFMHVVIHMRGMTHAHDRRVRLGGNLDLADSRSRRLREIDDAQDVTWVSELGNLDGTHI